MPWSARVWSSAAPTPGIAGCGWWPARHPPPPSSTRSTPWVPPCETGRGTASAGRNAASCPTPSNGSRTTSPPSPTTRPEETKGTPTTMELAGTSAIVTGGASGIGAASARALTKRGARCVLIDLNDELGEALASELSGLYVRADVADPEAVQAAVDAAVE